MMQTSDGLDAFRTEVRGWLEENYPASLRGGNALAVLARTMESNEADNDADTWRRRLGEKGWGAPSWAGVRSDWRFESLVIPVEVAPQRDLGLSGWHRDR